METINAQKKKEIEAALRQCEEIICKLDIDSTPKYAQTLVHRALAHVLTAKQAIGGMPVSNAR